MEPARIVVRPGELPDALDEQRLIDHQGLIRPSEDLALYRAEMAVWPGVGELRPWQVSVAAWVEANDVCRHDLLERLRGDGPLPASELPDTAEVPWPSSGWNNDKNVQMLLKQMVERGEVATAGGRGREKLWDLAERVYPDDPVPSLEEADRLIRDAVHEDEPFSTATRAAVDAEIDDLARWLGLPLSSSR